MRTMLDEDVVAMVADPTGSGAAASVALCEALIGALRELKKRDRATVYRAIDAKVQALHFTALTPAYELQ